MSSFAPLAMLLGFSTQSLTPSATPVGRASWDRIALVSNGPLPSVPALAKSPGPSGYGFQRKDIKSALSPKKFVYLQKPGSQLLVIVDRTLTPLLRVTLAKKVVEAALNKNGLLSYNDLPEEIADGLASGGTMPKDKSVPCVALEVSVAIRVSTSDGRTIMGPTVGGVSADAQIRQAKETLSAHSERVTPKDGIVSLSEYASLHLSLGYEFDYPEAVELTVNHIGELTSELQEQLTKLIRREDDKAGRSAADFAKHGSYRELSKEVRSSFENGVLKGLVAQGRLTEEQRSKTIADADVFQLIRNLRLHVPTADSGGSFVVGLGNFGYPLPRK